ncbi:MAG: hypothetical protein ABTQ25_13830 [Nitrosomonas ureae]
MATQSISVVDLDGANGFRLDGLAAGDFLGHSVSNAGDVNGDGFDDLVIGAVLVDSNGSNSGSSYVIFGKASGFNATMNLSSLNGSNGFRLDGLTANDGLGSSVSNAGDVNGDGLDDLIIGAGTDSNGTNSGSSYVVFGKASGFDASLDLSSLDGDTGFRVDGASSGGYGDSAGIAVSSAGDLNGDGYDDLIIGASREYNSSNPENPITVGYVVYGKASGFSSILQASSLTGSNGFRFTVPGEVAQSSSVSSAGDVNGDGLDDLIVGINFERSYRHITDKNDAYIIFGNTSGFGTEFDLASLDGNNGFRVPTPNGDIYDTSGIQVSNAGDINGDALDDLIIGSPSDSTDFYHGGNSYVVFGKDAGFDATLNLALDGSDGFRVRGETGDNGISTSVSSAGDVNGDGFDDLIIGASIDQNSSGQYSGTSYVVFGKASGFNAILDLTDLGTNEGFRVDGAAAFDGFGTSVSGAGDVNGDGFDDLLVGAERADPNGESSGSSYVIFGRSSFLDDEVDFPGTPGDDIFTGTSAAESFEGGDGNDRMIGRGGADSFDGGAGNDYIRILGDDFELVDGGTGNDTLGLAGSNFNLDLSSMIDKIHSIETIALYGNGDNTLTLTEQDVIGLSDSTNTVKVKGNAGDSVIGLSSGWIDGGLRGNFQEYTQGDAVLLIGVDVTTDFTIV